MAEQPLPGGFMTGVVRVGTTVRRRLPENAGFVHQLLGSLAAAGWAGAPRFLGLDEQGRETLSFIPGHVAWAPVPPASVGSDASLARTAELVREFHDLTARTTQAGSVVDGSEEVVCHNDLSPKNTVYRDAGAGLLPVAFIDWDLAAPGQRIHDVAQVCWTYLRLGTEMTDVARAARRIRLICTAYGLASRDGVIETILWWQERCWRGIEAGADAGDPAMIRLRAHAAFGEIQAAYAWVSGHHQDLSALTRRVPHG